MMADFIRNENLADREGNGRITLRDVLKKQAVTIGGE
jgi:hypothetical protein